MPKIEEQKAKEFAYKAHKGMKRKRKGITFYLSLGIS